MMPAPPRAVSSSAQAWDIMRDDVTLRQSMMTPGFNDQRQKDLSSLAYEDRQRGNAGYYLPARVELEIRDTNERAQALYDACCEVWEIHGLKKSRAFYRAVFDNCLQPLFGTRRAVVASELQHRDQVMQTAGLSSAAQGSLARRMDQLSATWNQRLERETRDCETRERVEREKTALVPTTQAQSDPTLTNRQVDERVTKLTDDQLRDNASTFTWKELESRFKEFQSKLTGQRFTATYIRTEWESGRLARNGSWVERLFGGRNLRI